MRVRDSTKIQAASDTYLLAGAHIKEAITSKDQAGVFANEADLVLDGQ